VNLRKDHSQTEHVSLTPGDARVRRSPRPLCDSRHAAARGACARRPLCYSPVGRRRSVGALRRRRLLHKRLVRGTRASDEPHQARRRQAGGLCQRYVARSAEQHRACASSDRVSGRGGAVSSLGAVRRAACRLACSVGCAWYTAAVSRSCAPHGCSLHPCAGPSWARGTRPGPTPGRSLDARWLPAWRRGVGMDE